LNVFSESLKPGNREYSFQHDALLDQRVPTLRLLGVDAAEVLLA